MSTAMSHKLMLRILYHNKPTTSSVIIDTVDLLAALSETLYMQKIIPRSEWCEDGWAGCIEQIEQSEPTNTLSMFIYKFHDATQCSKANGSDFANVFLEHSNPRKYPEGVDRNVAWSFYSLNSAADDSLEKYFKGEFNEIPTDNFTFPTPVEFQRRDCLLLSIQRQYPNISVKFVDATSQTQCHCQFTGGGDILIESTGTLATLVISEGITSDEDEKDVSPVYKGTLNSPTLSIECKKDAYPNNKLKYQLFANMMISAVTKFVQNLPFFTAKALKDLTTIEGYGIAYTGFGDVGSFKLIMKFGEPTRFTTKLKLERRYPHQAALRVDSLLDYYITKMDKMCTAK